MSMLPEGQAAKLKDAVDEADKQAKVKAAMDRGKRRAMPFGAELPAISVNRFHFHYTDRNVRITFGEEVGNSDVVEPRFAIVIDHREAAPFAQALLSGILRLYGLTPPPELAVRVAEELGPEKPAEEKPDEAKGAASNGKSPGGDGKPAAKKS